MKFKIQLIALLTHLNHEYNRMARIPLQVFLPSMITTFIYFLIFGAIIGQRVGTVDGVSYSLFITPGLVMISVITNSYTNTSSSLFSARFQRSVEELLISPMHQSIFLLGYVLGGVIRGVIVAVIVLSVSALFVDLHLKQIPIILLVTALFSSLFSLLGFTNGMLAKTFEEISIIPTFVLSPLTYLGGVFYSIDMLPPFWHKVALLNPIYYMVDILRFAMIGNCCTNIIFSISCIIAFLFAATMLNIIFLKKGIGIR